MTTTTTEKTTKKELMEKAESLGIVGITKDFPAKAIEMLIAQEEKRIEEKNRKSKNNEPALTAREKLLKKAESDTCKKAGEFLNDFQTPHSKKGEKGYFINDNPIKSNERSARMYAHYIVAYMYANDMLTETLKKAVENAFPNE